MKVLQSRFHFVGIGGVGMCGIAEILIRQGALVSGSDLSQNSNTERLQRLGAKIFSTHEAEHVHGADVLVYSTAIALNNPELLEAKKMRIPTIHRAEALAEIMRLKRGIAIAGTHGKTTTTSMVSAIMIENEMHPTVFVGGRFDMIDSTAQLGSGEWFVAEADESDGSFHKLSPEIAVITNIDTDHLDHFKNFERVKESFFDFGLRVSFYGHLIVCGDDPQTKRLFQRYPKKISFYGFDEQNDFVVQGGNGRYTLHQVATGQSIPYEMELPGRHNALNGAAAMICSYQAGIGFGKAAQALKKFRGADRRFQFKGDSKNGITLYDDYGHHPTEIKAVLQAFREKFPQRRIVIYFQPHRFTRTRDCWNDFLNCFTDCDVLYVSDIYPAGEPALAGINTSRLLDEIRIKNKHYLPLNDQTVQTLQKELRTGDVFVTLGAGNAWKLGESLLSII
ncbi:MAG: UDP-N-acetylmuramate--L-alanine ligase [Pseudobdellovibrionaceae bacterium]